MTLRLRVVRDDPELDVLRDPWNRLLDESQESNPFLTWEWQATTWRHFGAGRRLHVIVVEDDSGPCVILPMWESAVGFVGVRWRSLETLSGAAGDYGGVVLGGDASAAVPLVTEHLRGHVQRTGAELAFHRVWQDGPSARFIKTALHRLEESAAISETTLYSCPVMSLTALPEGFQPPKTHDIRRAVKKLRTEPGYRFVYHDGEELSASLERLVVLHEKRWAGRYDEYQGALASGPRRAFTRDVTEAVNGRDFVRMSFVSVDGRDLAGALSFEHTDRFYYLRPAFDPAFARFSPGHTLIYELAAEAKTRGIREFDFLRGAENYKLAWAEGERRVATFRVQTSGFRGRAARASGRLFRRLTRGVSGPKQMVAGGSEIAT